MNNAATLHASPTPFVARYGLTDLFRRAWLILAACTLVAFSALASPSAAQDMETFDPDEAFAPAPASTGTSTATPPNDTGAIDADLGPLPTGQPAPLPVAKPLGSQPPSPSTPNPAAPQDDFDTALSIYAEPPVNGAAPEPSPVVEAPVDSAPTVAASDQTFAEDDLIGAAEGVFGKGAKGLAKMIEGLLRKEGRPNGYIVGREAGGAFIVGARYGSGTLHHKVEGERKVYWTGPSVGFDAGANAANTFVLVYNLWDSEDLFKRYPAGEGQAYFVGGLHASYVRRGDVVLIPIRMGAGVRLGVNAGYMRFSKKQRWLPF